jgi:hypothetical protein
MIFISYSSHDLAIAEKICSDLERRGLSCWIARRNIGPGENFQESIVHAIRSSRIMILIFTANANHSSEMKKELVLAGQQNLIVIPIRIENVPPNDAFAYEFTTRQWIDFFDCWDRAIEQLAAQISANISEDGSTIRLESSARQGAVLHPSTRRASIPSKTMKVLTASGLYVLVTVAAMTVLSLCAITLELPRSLLTLSTALIALAAGFLLSRRAHLRTVDSIFVGLLIATLAIICMLSIVSMVESVPMLPANATEWGQILVFLLVITGAVAAGNLASRWRTRNTTDIASVQ